jgi:hypothetical protein
MTLLEQLTALTDPSIPMKELLRDIILEQCKCCNTGAPDVAIWADETARALVVPEMIGALGVQLSDQSVWMGTAVVAGDWEPVYPHVPDGHTYVRTAGEFTTALAGTDAHTIHLAADLTLAGAVVVPFGKTVVPNNYQLIHSAGATIQFFGLLDADRRQVFSGWAPGEIVGTFGSHEVFPEWWGLVTGQHDIAINSALAASSLATNGFAIKVSLAARIYDVAAPLDLSSKAATLEGAGSNLTLIESTATWDATWLKADHWGAPTGSPNHAAMIWIGADLTGDAAIDARSYHTKVKGLNLNCWQAAFAHRAGGLKRVSGISSKRWVEECSVIHDVVISNPSGFGIGFCQHKAPGADWSGGATGAAVVNGLDISSCWIMGATFRDMVPVHFSQWSNNCRLSMSTIDAGLSKSLSTLHATGGAPGGADTRVSPTDWPVPIWICDYPQVAIMAKGFCSIEDVHIEGTVIGVNVRESSSQDNVFIKNLKCFAMMDPVHGAVYELDGWSGADPAPNTDNYNYSCAVMIGGFGEAPTYSYPNDNWRARVVVNNVSTNGICSYLLRDSVYGIEHTSYDMGQFPATGAGCIAFYTRGNVYVGPVSDGVTIYQKLTPATDRAYFLGPIY